MKKVTIGAKSGEAMALPAALLPMALSIKSGEAVPSSLLSKCMNADCDGTSVIWSPSGQHICNCIIEGSTLNMPNKVVRIRTWLPYRETLS